MGGLVDALFGGGDAPPPPDYTPVAQASKEAAEISAKLGREQLDEAKRQYDQNMAVAAPVVNAQLQVMQQGIQQGNDYYNYQQGFRPLEQSMLAQVSGISAEDMARVQSMRNDAEAAARSTWEQQQAARRAQLEQEIAAVQAQAQFSGTVDYGAAEAEQQRLTMAGIAAKQAKDKAEIDAITGEVRGNAGELLDRTRAYEAQAAADIALATGGNKGIADRYGADIENDVGTAMADTRVGQTQALATAARQAARYGLAVPSNVQAVSNQNAAQLAAAANTTRNASTDKYRGLVMQGIGLKQNAFTTGQAATTDAMGKAEGATRAGRDMRIQQESLDWAKQLDVTGMARGMPGASQGAYGLAVSAGNSATQNQMAPGNALLGAMNQSAQTQMSGQQIAMQGLTSVLGAQGQYNGQVSSANTARTGQILDMVGTGLGMAFSDIRLKRDIVKVADDPRGFGWYEFTYKAGGGRHIGVIAQEIEQVMPGAVTEIGGAKAVYYHML